MMFSGVCLTGTTGLVCETKISKCDSGPCKNGGKCTEDASGTDGVKCECIPGRFVFMSLSM